MSIQKLEESWWNEDVLEEESKICQNQDSTKYCCCFKSFFVVVAVLWKLKIFSCGMEKLQKWAEVIKEGLTLPWCTSLRGRFDWEGVQQWSKQIPLSWVKMNQTQFFVIDTFSFSCCLVCIWDHDTFNSLVIYLFYLFILILVLFMSFRKNRVEDLQ